MKTNNDYHIRYVVTSMHKDGLRHMVGANNHYSTYLTEEAAQQHLKDILENNSIERIEELMGTDLKVMPTTCYSSGDSTRTVWAQ